LLSGFVSALFTSEVEKRLEVLDRRIAKLKNDVKNLVNGPQEQGFFSKLFSIDPDSEEEVRKDVAGKIAFIRQFEAEKDAILLRDKERAAERKVSRDQEIEEIFNLSEAFRELNIGESFAQGFTALDGLGTKATTEAEIAKAAIKSLEQQIVKFGKSAKIALANGLGQGFAAVGRALVEGTNALDAFLGAFLSQIGQAMIAQGTQFILTGIGYQFIPGFQGIGAGLIGAGAALAVAGGALSAVAGSISKPSTSGAGGAQADTAATTIGVDDSIVGEQEERKPKITINIQGDVLDSDQTGLRIVELINKSVDDSSVQIRQGAFA